MDDLISIIVPVYNAEKYIERCLESLIHQSYENLEIIVINDGSKDESEGVISRYLNDSRIVYFSQQNQGIGLTRNYGLELVHGKYFCFVDSDDYVASDFVEKLHEVIVSSNADLVWCDYVHVFNGKTQVIHQRPEEILKFEYPCLWNKMYKTALFKENRLIFPDSWYEDLATVPRAFLLAENTYYLNEALYYYWQHDNSITTTFSIHASDMNLVLDILNTFFSQLKRNDLDISWIQNYIIIFHGLCGTVFRMMLSNDHTSKEICSFYSQTVNRLNGKRFDIEILKRLPIKYKLFYLSLWKWSIPIVRYAIIVMKRI
ncbi:MAG: glycosyltransferase family 2 protein [Erysipelotrichaceae bacterium]|nr:glycosyltransferase family 2 protein [Erysipelotrichaceae bacterium]